MCVVVQRKKQMANEHNNVFIKYQYSYMFRSLEVAVGLALENFNILHNIKGDRGGTAVKVLCYKSEGRWFDYRQCDWNFSLT